MRELIERQHANPEQRLFIKQMAHHLVDIDLGFLKKTRNIFLIRDPREMLPSLTIQVPHAQLADTGLKRQWELVEMLDTAGESAVVLDSRELLLSPPTILRQLCDALGIDYIDAMLSWPAGPIPEDGVWAPHWYHAVHKSTGFAPYVKKTDFPQSLEALLRECQPWYDKLYERALKAPAGDS